jgi:hypothetical protein
VAKSLQSSAVDSKAEHLADRASRKAVQRLTVTYIVPEASHAIPSVLVSTKPCADSHIRSLG